MLKVTQVVSGQRQDLRPSSMAPDIMLFTITSGYLSKGKKKNLVKFKEKDNNIIGILLPKF